MCGSASIALHVAAAGDSRPAAGQDSLSDIRCSGFTIAGKGTIEAKDDEYVVVRYASPDYSPVDLSFDRPVPLPDDCRRLGFLVYFDAGSATLSFLLRDASGKQHAVPAIMSTPTAKTAFHSKLNVREWSGWHQGRSTELKTPGEVSEHVMPEYREKAQSLIWKQPLSLVGIRVSPFKPVKPFEDRPPFHCGKDELPELKAGTGKFTLHSLRFDTSTPFEKRNFWLLAERDRYGAAGEPLIFPDDISSRDAGTFSYELACRRGYQGPVVWETKGILTTDKTKPLDLLAHSIRAVPLPEGRYFLTIRTHYHPSGKLENVRHLQLRILEGESRELPSLADAAAWHTGHPFHVFPAGVTKPEIRLTFKPETWSSVKGQAECRVNIVDWTGVKVYSRVFPKSEEIILNPDGMKSGTDYFATAEIFRGDVVFDRFELHFGIASPAETRPASAPGGIPKVADYIRGQARPHAEYKRPMITHAYPYLLNWDEQKFTEWVRQAAAIGGDSASLQAVWGEIEPLPGVYHWDFLEKHVAQLNNSGLKTYFTFSGYIDGAVLYPIWLDYAPLRTGDGYLYHPCAHFGWTWDHQARMKNAEYYRRLARRFADNPSVLGYRLNTPRYKSEALPEETRCDYSKPAQQEFNRWLVTQKRTPYPLPNVFFIPNATAVDFSGIGPDVSQAWRDFVSFNIYSYQSFVKELVGAIREVDPVRQIHVYRGSNPYACESVISMLDDGCALQDEGGPEFRENAMRSMCLQAGVPYLGELHRHVPTSKAIADAMYFWGAYNAEGVFWLLRWSEDHIDGKKSKVKPFDSTRSMLEYMQTSLPAMKTWLASKAVPPRVLVVGSRLDALLQTPRRGYWSDMAGLDVFAALFSYHQVPAHFANEYCDWVEFNQFPLIFARGEIMTDELIRKLSDYAASGGKLVVVGNAGSLNLHDANDASLSLKERLISRENVRFVPLPTLPPPYPGELPWYAPCAFDNAELDGVLEWAGVKRNIRTEQPGFECQLRKSLDGNAWFAAVRHRWKGWYRGNAEDDEVLERKAKQKEATVVINGLEDGNWMITQFHRQAGDTFQAEASMGTIRFQAPPSFPGELQLFRIVNQPIK
jgi:hypothetical protein